MEYRVVLIESEEGFSVRCPALNGCHSQSNPKNAFTMSSIASDAGFTKKEFKELL